MTNDTLASVLYTQDQIVGYYTAKEGENSSHLVLHDLERGLVGTAIIEGCVNGKMINDGTETDSPFGYQVLRLYQGLSTTAAEDIRRWVHKACALRTNKVTQTQLVESIEKIFLYPDAKGTPLQKVEDMNWLGGYKWTTIEGAYQK